MIIDAHTHIGSGTNLEMRFAGSQKANLDRMLQEMKASGVDHALILPYPKGVSAISIVESTLATAHGVANVSVLGTVHIDHLESDLPKLEEWLREKKIVGVKLYLGYQHFYPNEERCKPIYALCEKYGVPVVFHTGDTVSYEKAAKVKYAHPLAIDDVAVDFPGVRFVIAHMGNPWLMDCTEVIYKNENVYTDLSGLVEDAASLKSPYGKLMKQRIQDMIAYASPRKLIYGTDWPLAPMKDYIKFVKSLGIGKKDLKYVFCKNAAELFKIGQ